MNRNKIISIILTTYNRPEFLWECLESCIYQDYPYKEILVIDDGSEYMNRMNNENIIQALKTKHENEKIICLYKQNGGCSSAYNYGISRASGGFICIMHDDDKYYNRSVLSNLIEPFFKYPYLEMVYGQPVDLVKGKEQRAKADFPVPPVLILKDDYIYLTVMMWRKSAFEKIGLFDEELRSNEDFDIEIRSIMELSTFFIPTPVVFYRRHPGNKSTINAGKMDYYKRIFLRKLKERYKDLILMEKA
jgi:glycosyltransferase involved in cell wall biosynthesis